VADCSVSLAQGSYLARKTRAVKGIEQQTVAAEGRMGTLNQGRDNNKMQRTKHGLDGASPLILVLG
jgi:hypothetical protein